MKLLILSDLHAELETFEVLNGLDYDVAVLAGDIVAPGRVVALWLRNPRRFGGKPVVQIAGNHEYYESLLDQEEARMRRGAEEQGVHFLNCDEVVLAGVRFLGCTLWTDFRLRIDNPGFAGQPVRLLSDRYRSMTECSRYMADYTAREATCPPRRPIAGRARCCRRAGTSAKHTSNDPARRRCMTRAVAGRQRWGIARRRSTTSSSAPGGLPQDRAQKPAAGDGRVLGRGRI